MKKLLSLALALTLLLALAVPAFAVSEGFAAIEAMERFMASGGAAEQVDELKVYQNDIDDHLWCYYYIDFDRDGIPELLRVYYRDAVQGSMDVFCAKRSGDGFELTKVASFVDDGYHVLFGGTDVIYRLGCFGDGTYGISCHKPEYKVEFGEDAELVSDTCIYYVYRDGAFRETEENGFREGLQTNASGPFGVFPLSDYGAQLSAQGLRVDGREIVCEKYNIFGSNYFKLRDLAMLLNGTPAQFSIGWDEEEGVISIVPGEPYEPVGGELKLGADRSASAEPSAQAVMIDGYLRDDLTAFNLGGNNFFKLRDLGKALGFSVDYDAAANAAVIVTAG